MAFPTIPTVAAGRVLWATSTDTSGGTVTSPNLSSLTKNSGDLLIAIVITYDGNSTNAEFSSWGGSFTEFVDQATTTTMAIGAAYKWSTGSETGTFTVAVSGGAAGSDAVFCLLSIPGAHASTPPEGGTIANGTSSAADPGSFNPSGWDTEDTLWIAVAGSGETGTAGSYTGIASAPTNYTNYSDSGITADVVGGVEGAVAFRQLNAASEDVGTFSVDTSNARNSALIIAVRPAPSTTPVNLSYSHVGTLTKVRQVGAIKAYSHVGTEIVVKAVTIGAKPYSHVGTLSTTKGLLFNVSKAFSHVGTAAYSKLIQINRAFSHVGTETVSKAVSLIAKAYSHVGSLVTTKGLQYSVSKAFSHIGSLVSTETLILGVNKAYSHVGTFLQENVAQFFKTLAYSAVHTLTKITNFIPAGGGGFFRRIRSFGFGVGLNK